MDINNTLYLAAAKKLKLPIILLKKEMNGFKLFIGNNHYYFRGAETPFNNSSATNVAINKYCINKLLDKAGIPVPKTIGITDTALKKGHLNKLIKSLTFPLVIKPTVNSRMGKNVICNIQNIDSLTFHLNFLQSTKKINIINIEEFHVGLRDYRIHIFYGKILSIVERIPAFVIGNGTDTLEKLIHDKNIMREKQADNLSLGPIETNELEFSIRLKELNLSLSDIPENNRYIQLFYKCNSTNGGTMHGYPAQHICPSTAKLAIKAAKVLNLNHVGFDVRCTNILSPLNENKLVFIEANNVPDISIIENPLEGISNPISIKILRHLIFKHPLSYIMHRLRIVLGI